MSQRYIHHQWRGIGHDTFLHKPDKFSLDSQILPRRWCSLQAASGQASAKRAQSFTTPYRGHMTTPCLVPRIATTMRIYYIISDIVIILPLQRRSIPSSLLPLVGLFAFGARVASHALVEPVPNRGNRRGSNGGRLSMARDTWSAMVGRVPFCWMPDREGPHACRHRW